MKNNDNLFILILLFAGILIYLPSVTSGFIFDDNHMIVENLFIKSPDHFNMFFKGFVSSYPLPKGMVRPVLMLTFAFNYFSAKLNPIGYHIV
ncbi:MAG: hypothetical protein ABH872_04240, partial [Candidatus Omnitrophota bacterium]